MTIETLALLIQNHNRNYKDTLALTSEVQQPGWQIKITRNEEVLYLLICGSEQVCVTRMFQAIMPMIALAHIAQGEYKPINS